MYRFTKRLPLAAAVLALVSACHADDPTAPPDADPGQLTAGTAASPPQTDRTPFQLALMETMARRVADGLPVPSDVSFDYQGAPIGVQAVGLAGQSTVVVATTVVHFDSPAQAGHDKWPDLVVHDTRGPGVEGIVREGDYTQFIKEKTAEQIPGVWQEYEFGYEPRTYTFTETIATTFPESHSVSTLGTATFADEFLWGSPFRGRRSTIR